MAGKSSDLLSERIKADNAFFKDLFDLIPARVYFDEDTRGKIRNRNSEDGDLFEDDSDAVGPKTKKKDESKGRKRKKMMDPLECKTVTQIQEELHTEQSTATSYTKVKSKKKRKKDPYREKRELRSVTTNLEELRERLQNRIEELKGKRGHLSSQEWVEKKKLKRKKSKLNLKMRRKAEKQNMTKGENSDSKVIVNGKPVFNKEGKVVFSKFDFTEVAKKSKNNMSDLTGKDYKKILENLEKRKEKIKELREKDVLAARNLEKKTTWQAAISKAEGVKIKDNPEQLKKALKRKEKRKEKSKSSWESREKTVADKQKAKQDKRQKNIQSRKQAKVDKKIKKAKKKGRTLPGF